MIAARKMGWSGASTKAVADRFCTLSSGPLLFELQFVWAIKKSALDLGMVSERFKVILCGYDAPLLIEMFR